MSVDKKGWECIGATTRPNAITTYLYISGHEPDKQQNDGIWETLDTREMDVNITVVDQKGDLYP